MKNFLLTPFYALYKPSLYRDAVRNGRVKQAFVFLIYLSFIYLAGSFFGLVRMSRQFPEYTGRFDEKHMLMRFLSEAPPQWRLARDGLSLTGEDGKPVEQWSFGNLIYVDTTQESDFVPPDTYSLVVSKTLSWSPYDQNARAFRFREWYERVGQDVNLVIHRDAAGMFDHFEISGRGGTRNVTRADLAGTIRLMKLIIFLAIFVVLWPVLFIYRLGAIAFLSLFGLLMNAISKSALSYSRIFILCALAQSWVLVIDILFAVFPLLAPVRGLAGLLVSVGFLWVIFYRFLPQPEERQAPAS